MREIEERFIVICDTDWDEGEEWLEGRKEGRYDIRLSLHWDYAVWESSSPK